MWILYTWYHSECVTEWIIGEISLISVSSKTTGTILPSVTAVDLILLMYNKLIIAAEDRVS
jgi:hypothetical protein